MDDSSLNKPSTFGPFGSLTAAAASRSLARMPKRVHIAILSVFLLIITLQLVVRPTPLPLRSPSWGRQRSSCVGFFGHGGGLPRREVTMSIMEFGGVGDGKTSNTAVFRKAVSHMKGLEGRGGSQLNVPRGTWLTGSFNVTSNFTLFLEEGAVILGSQNPEEWPIIEPLPSYGRGRERLGGRHISLIHGDSLTDVVITGNNGTIDGQGKMWWDLWWNRTLEHTRGHLLELVNSENILISNLTFRNSPFWTIHPVYCRNVVIKDMTVLAPLNAPNTDGIDPDSCTNVCIEDCYIESGDDLVAVKSGWDQYGIAAARPSSNIVIRRISGMTPTFRRDMLAEHHFARFSSDSEVALCIRQWICQRRISIGLEFRQILETGSRKIMFRTHYSVHLSVLVHQLLVKSSFSVLGG